MRPPCAPVTADDGSAPDGPFQLRLRHRRPSGHSHVARLLVELTAGAATRTRMGAQSSPPCRRDVVDRGPAGGPALACARSLLVDRPGRDLLGHVVRFASRLEPFLDVSELAPALGTPRMCCHDQSFRPSGRRPSARPTAGRRTPERQLSSSPVVPSQTPDCRPTCTGPAGAPSGRSCHTVLVTATRECHDLPMPGRR
jgi:hypothetical protein